MSKKISNKYLLLLSMQGLNILFSLSDVLTKLASRSWEQVGFFSIHTLGFLSCSIFLLGIYAVFWQMVLKRTELSTAYLNKATILFWGMLWAVIIFKEKMTVLNMLGTVIIFAGVLMVNDHE